MTAPSTFVGLPSSLAIECSGCYVLANVTFQYLTNSPGQYASVDGILYILPLWAFLYLLGLSGNSNPLTAHLIFTAYSVTSSFMIASRCSVTSGPIVIITPLTFEAPSGISEVLTNAERTFLSYIGLPTCVPGGKDSNFGIELLSITTASSDSRSTIVLPVTPITKLISAYKTIDARTSMATSISLANLTSQTFPLSLTTTILRLSPSSARLISPGLDRGAKIGLGLGVPVTIGLTVFGIFLWRGYTKMQTELRSKKT